ncbi:hypothetical protein QBC47DRAFT_389907 [Echria macrotheca]|uniref:SMODS and SLOG-associating 2TM effector domain-containing protein n=1 Tax=Echria macrotheca TaxID=438768 RepID=A0AAJ0B5R5_9PEZI|nr:hypothetical protein QBC47DRAFT_389907 [Echria macrotheca]
MASIGDRDAKHRSLPPMKPDQHSETADSIYKSERPSSIPLPIPNGRPGNGGPVFTKPLPPPGLPPPKPLTAPVPHRFLTPAEWARVAHGVGAIGEGETHSVVHPTCWYWPPKGLPEGLYRDVVTQRSKYCIAYHIVSTLRWFLMLLQIVLGAILTALGSVQQRVNIPITVLAAINTIDAGLLALMHNSGLPDRYRLDKVEFTKVEDFLKELLDTGIVETGQNVDDVLCDCFGRFQAAKNTVLANMPDAYTIPPSAKQKLAYPDPPGQF